MNTHIYWHPDIPLHDAESMHPLLESCRLIEIANVLHDIQGSCFVEATPAKSDDILRVHSSELIEELNRLAPTEVGGRHCIDYDTCMTRHTMRTISLSSGAVVDAVDAVLAGDATNAFCIAYAGHHAGPNKAHGFCFINNIAIGAMHAVAKGARVVIVDFDTHSGNGTVWAVRDNSKVYFAETYQPGFPGKIMSEYDKPLNIMRRLVMSRNDWLRAWGDELLPSVRAFNPDIILVSAGFDAHENDPLGITGLKNEDYVWLTRELMTIQPRIVSALEGGYSLPDTTACVRLHVEELAK